MAKEATSLAAPFLVVFRALLKPEGRTRFTSDLLPHDGLAPEEGVAG